LRRFIEIPTADYSFKVRPANVYHSTINQVFGGSSRIDFEKCCFYISNGCHCGAYFSNIKIIMT